MRNQSTVASSGTIILARVTALALLLFFLLFLFGCGGASTGSNFVSPPPPPPPNGGIASSNFGMQCGIGPPIYGQVNCYGGNTILWPTAGLNPPVQPGLLRLHDAGTYWSALAPSAGPCATNCDFTKLDAWLDIIAQHQPLAVSQVFTWVPCWDTVGGSSNPNCGIDPNAPNGTNYPPTDLGTSGSATFTDFVNTFTQHCSPAGNCVGNCPSGATCASTNLIQYYEMWNEWDISYHWLQGAAPPNGCGTTMMACAQLLYQMVAPATTAIRANVKGAVIFTPSATPASPTYQNDFKTWLSLENTNASSHISDWITWHVYLTTPSGSSTNLPEDQWNNYNANFLSIQQSTSGWENTPWANTETNFSGSTTVNYQCPSIYSPTDCTGQIVRWQILHDSNGGSGLYWYYWLDTIGSNPQYETAYYWMMQYMVGGKYTGPATSSNGVWTAPFTEENGTTAMWVWTTSESGASFTVPSGFSDYKDLQGDPAALITAGTPLPVTTQPIMLEQ